MDEGLIRFSSVGKCDSCMWVLKLPAVDLQPLAQTYARGRGLIWLDSSSRSLRFDRYSYLCIDPVESIPATAKMDDLRSVLRRYTTVRCMDDGPPFQGGLVGFLITSLPKMVPQ